MNERTFVDTGSPLARLAGKLGIEISYRGADHQERHIDHDAAVALIQALGFDARDDDAIARSLDELVLEPWSRVLEPVVTIPPQDALSVPLVLPRKGGPDALTWRVEHEGGHAEEGGFSPVSLPEEESRHIRGEEYVRRCLDTGCVLTPGYHRLRILGLGGEVSQKVICAPERCFLPEQAKTFWGIAVQLYALRSDGNWGMGDFSDLVQFAQRAAGCGISMVGTNPLHALHSGQGGNSPYFPSNRLFLNILYLDVEAVPEFTSCPTAQAFVQSPEFQARATRLRDENLVDYAAIAELKMSVLEDLYACFRKTYLDAPEKQADRRLLDFRNYQQTTGPDLLNYATFETLSEQIGQDVFWREWPEEFRRPDASGVSAFAKSHHSRIEFFQYLQWEAERQLRSAENACASFGMQVGLYGDIALGTAAHGGEAWAVQDSLCFGVRVGAPPDAFNQLGQDWGFPPFDPRALRHRGYAPFISMLRASMRHFGAIRLDHVMSLARLFWIPPGKSAVDGAYVRYPLDDLMAIVRLESQRNQCIVVGEDLGTVPHNFREYLAGSGVLSYRVLYFERKDDGAFMEPDRYPNQALATASTHDLPTLAGYWLGRDLDEKARLKLFSSQDAEEGAREDRRVDRRRLREFLSLYGDLPDQAPNELEHDALVAAVIKTLAKTPCLLVSLQIEDLLGVEEQANMPGTIDQHPNWRRKLPSKTSQIFTRPVFDCLRKLIEA